MAEVIFFTDFVSIYICLYIHYVLLNFSYVCSSQITSFIISTVYFHMRQTYSCNRFHYWLIHRSLEIYMYESDGFTAVWNVMLLFMGQYIPFPSMHSLQVLLCTLASIWISHNCLKIWRHGHSKLIHSVADLWYLPLYIKMLIYDICHFISKCWFMIFATFCQNAVYEIYHFI